MYNYQENSKEKEEAMTIADRTYISHPRKDGDSVEVELERIGGRSSTYPLTVMK